MFNFVMGGRERGTEQKRLYTKGRGIGDSLFGEENLHVRQIQRTEKVWALLFLINFHLKESLLLKVNSQSVFQENFLMIRFEVMPLDLA